MILLIWAKVQDICSLTTPAPDQAPSQKTKTMEIKKFETEVGGRKLSIETGKLALNATSSVMVTYGETVILATVVISKNERSAITYFPLTVDFDEKLYAAGRIKGSRWIKREG